jgi:hypothetical protein
MIKNIHFLSISDIALPCQSTSQWRNIMRKEIKNFPEKKKSINDIDELIDLSYWHFWTIYNQHCARRVLMIKV